MASAMWLWAFLAGAVAEVTPLPVVFHVAPGAEGPVVDEAWLDAQVEQANGIFAEHGVRFVRAGVRALPAEHGVLEDRAGRNALGAFLEAGVVNAFIVESLRDVDDPEVLRQGVHWRPFGRKVGRRGWVPHLVIVAAYARPTVLAHELGHFFGNPNHTATKGNLMSYDRGPGPPTLDATQGRRVRQHVRRFLRSGEVRPAKLEAEGAGP